jgi:predicted nucleotidyltransferase
LSGDDSDVDRRGIYLPPAELHWSLYGVPEQTENNDTQEVYWELQKFLVMALKANPNILECLHTPLVEHAAPLAEELLAHRKVFLSKLIYQTYNGYVMSQFKKLEQDLRARGDIKWKHAMHLMRCSTESIERWSTLRPAAKQLGSSPRSNPKAFSGRAWEIQWRGLSVLGRESNLLVGSNESHFSAVVLPSHRHLPAQKSKEPL